MYPPLPPHPWKSSGSFKAESLVPTCNGKNPNFDCDGCPKNYEKVNRNNSTVYLKRTDVSIWDICRCSVLSYVAYITERETNVVLETKPYICRDFYAHRNIFSNAACSPLFGVFLFPWNRISRMTLEARAHLVFFFGMKAGLWSRRSCQGEEWRGI
jgi:hypothetical protein